MRRGILKLFADGLTYQEIGEIRNNSALTVRNAVSGCAEEAGVQDQAADGDLGGAGRPGGWWLGITLSIHRGLAMLPRISWG